MDRLPAGWWSKDRDVRLTRLLKYGRSFTNVAFLMGITVDQARNRAGVLGIRDGFDQMMTGEEITEADIRARDRMFIEHMAKAYKRGEFPRA